MLDAEAAVLAATGTLARIELTPGAPHAGEALRLSAAGSLVAAGRSLVGHEWTLAAEAGVVAGFAGATNGPEAELRPTAAGTVTVSLVVVDDAGQRATAQRSISIAAPVPAPVADAPADAAPVASGDGGGASSLMWVGLLALAVAVLLHIRLRGLVWRRKPPGQ
jgi:hypothetical protein